jgi:hypothetical protein
MTPSRPGLKSGSLVAVVMGCSSVGCVTRGRG